MLSRGRENGGGVLRGVGPLTDLDENHATLGITFLGEHWDSCARPLRQLMTFSVRLELESFQTQLKLQEVFLACSRMPC